MVNHARSCPNDASGSFLRRPSSPPVASQSQLGKALTTFSRRGMLGYESLLPIARLSRRTFWAVAGAGAVFLAILPFAWSRSPFETVPYTLRFCSGGKETPSAEYSGLEPLNRFNLSPLPSANHSRIFHASQKPVRSKHTHSIYSGSNCVGPGDDVNARCHFKNIGIQLTGEPVNPDHPKSNVAQSFKLLYYRPAEMKADGDTPNSVPPIYWHERFKSAGPWARFASPTGAAVIPLVLYGDGIPENAFWSTSENTVFTGSFWPENYGHALGDDFFPIYRLAKQFG